MIDWLRSYGCLFFGHRLGPELHSECGKWSFRACSRCGRLETTKRPPALTIRIGVGVPALSAAELIEQSGQPNMLEGRELQLTIPTEPAGGAR